jgi:O-antigen/teichoic acid export membrane protein
VTDPAAGDRAAGELQALGLPTTMGLPAGAPGMSATGEPEAELTVRRPRLSSDLVVYGLGEAFVKAIAFITLPIYTRIFTPAEYGELSLAITVVGLIGTVLVLGGDSAYARFFFEAKTLTARRVLGTTWIGFLIFWSTLVALSCVVAARPLSELVFGDDRGVLLIIAGLIAAPLAQANTMLGQVLRNEFRAIPFTVLNLATVALTVSLGVTFVAFFRLGPLGVLIGTFVAQLAMLPFRAWTVRDAFGRQVDLSLLRRLLAYGIPLVPTSLAFWVFLTSDRILLGRLSTLDQLGLYSVAVSLVGLANVAIAALGQAWTPHLIRMFEENRDGAARFVGRMLVYSVAGFGFLAVTFTAFAPEVLDVLSGEGFHGAAAAVGPLALGMVAFASNQMTAAGISLMKRTSYLALHAWIAAVINVALNFVLDPPFGMLGAAWATAIAYAYLSLAFLATSQRLWPIVIPTGRLVVAIVLVIAYTVAASAFPSLGLVEAIVVKGAFSASFVVLLFVGRVIGRDEVELAVQLLRTALRRPASR